MAVQSLGNWWLWKPVGLLDGGPRVGQSTRGIEVQASRGARGQDPDGPWLVAGRLQQRFIEAFEDGPRGARMRNPGQ